MKSTYRFAGASLCALILATAATTQTAPIPTVPVGTAQSPAVLRLGTSVRLRTEEPLSSKTTKTGDRFHLRVVEDVKVGDMTVIPAGAIAMGEVTNVTKKGSFGKSGKLDTRLLYVVIGDRNVPLTGTSHDAGSGGTGATVAAAIAVGVFSAFVTGHSAEYPVGSQMTAFTENDLPIVASMAVAPQPLIVPAISRVSAPAPTPETAVLTPVSASAPTPPAAMPKP